MKIAQIVCVFPPYLGGIGNSVYNISEALAKLDYEVTVFTPQYDYLDDKNIVPDQIDASNSKFIVQKLKPMLQFGNGAFIPGLFFRLNGFDIIHLHYPFYGGIKAVLLKKLFAGKKLKLILHYHMDSRAKGLKGSIFYFYRIFFLPILARCAKVITCASLDYIKHSDLSAYYRLKPNKFRQISFGVNLEQFVIYNDEVNKRREQPVILFVGGLDKAHYFKGLENLIKALAEIKKNSRFSSTLLKVVGRGDLIEYYKQCAETLGVKDAVFFYEEIDNSKLVDFYNYCDCVALPSINKSEAFGLVLLEAMACAKPVVTSNLPGVRSVFKNNKQGLLVKPDNVKDLVEKLQVILGDKKRSELMGLAGRELVEKKYTWEKVGKRLDVIYNYAKYT